MIKTIDPKLFDLPARTVIEITGQGSYAIVIDRKSRIIMSDGKKILEKSELIQQKEPHATIQLKTSAPVCSKTITFLKENDIEVLPI